MIIRIEDLKEMCSKILAATDTSELSQITDVLSLKSEGSFIYLSVTNHEYYAQARFNMNEEVDFSAAVNAKLFLNLILSTTTDTVELTVDNNSLIVKGNGTYKLPLLFDGDKLLEIPRIDIENVTSSFTIPTSILHSICTYNKISPQNVSTTIQKLYYVDDNGAITFGIGACVNKFKLESPIKMLLSPKIVKLFKLFKGDSVKFSYGVDPYGESSTQTKVSFIDETTMISAIISNDDSLMNTVPSDVIRNIASASYPFQVSVNKTELLDVLKRLTLFTDKTNPYCRLKFASDSFKIFDIDCNNSENLFYESENIECPNYDAILSLTDFKSTLESCADKYINISFGDHKAFVISRGDIYNVIPEVIEN